MARQRQSVLIVEDDDLMVAFYRRLFGQHKDEFDCRFAKNGKEALANLQEGKSETLLLDWDLPGISGLDLLRALRSNPETKSARIIIVSGRSHPDDQVRALGAGADDYLTKPFNVEVLLARLRALKRR